MGRLASGITGRYNIRASASSAPRKQRGVASSGYPLGKYDGVRPRSDRRSRRSASVYRGRTG